MELMDVKRKKMLRVSYLLKGIIFSSIIIIAMFVAVRQGANFDAVLPGVVLYLILINSMLGAWYLLRVKYLQETQKESNLNKYGYRVLGYALLLLAGTILGLVVMFLENILLGTAIMLINGCVFMLLITRLLRNRTSPPN